VKPPAPTSRSRKGKRRGNAADEVHPHVLAVLQAVWRATATRPVPYYVSVASLGPRHAPPTSPVA
jgi:hypothetical protein